MTTSRIPALVFAGALIFAACGDDDTTAESLPVDDGSGAASACLEGDPDCEDTGDASSDQPQLEPGDEDSAPPAQGMCLPEDPDCEDTVVTDNDADDSTGQSDDPADLDAHDEELRQAAKALLGVAEDDLDGDVRIARRGAEEYSLTEDYVVGRMTVELEDDGSGTFVVVSVTVELNNTPETFTNEG